MVRSLKLLSAAAVALVAVAGAAQAQTAPGGRGFGPRFDDRGPPPGGSQDRFDRRYNNGPQNNNNRPNNNGPTQTAGGWLGVQLQPLDAALADALKLPSNNGALISDVQAGSPAATAGIKAGDVVLSVDGKATNNARDLASLVAGDQPNTKVTVTVWRQGAKQDVAVTLGSAPGNGRVGQNQGGQTNPPAPAVPPSLGLTIAPASGQSGGVVITSVDRNSPAERAGLSNGDQILMVGNASVSTTSDVAKAVNAARQSGAKTVLMQVKTDRGNRFVAVALG